MTKDWRLEKTSITSIVAESLREVADFPLGSDIVSYTFDKFLGFHKVVFLASLKKNLLSQEYDDGQGHVFYYDAALNVDLIEQWKTLRDCIDYVFEQQSTALKQANVVYP